MKWLGSFRENKNWLILAALLVGLSACQKSGSSSRKTVAQTPVGVAAGCTNCFQKPEFIATTDSDKINGALYMGLDFYGDLATGLNFQDPKIPTFYQGPVQAQGRISIRAIDPMLCNAPVGEYTVRTAIVGNWSMGLIGGALSGPGPVGMKLEAVGTNKVKLIVSVIKGIIYNSTSAYGTNKLDINRLGGTFAIEAVNNQPCMMAGSIELF